MTLTLGLTFLGLDWAEAQTTPNEPLDVASLTEVTDEVDVVLSGLRYQSTRRKFLGFVHIANRTSRELGAPLYIVADQRSPSDLGIDNRHGLTVEGSEYFELVNALASGASSDLIPLVMTNPARAPITLTFRVFEPGSIDPPANRPPAFVSAPVTQGAENSPYRYTAAANDPDLGDVVRYRLTSGPPGLTVDLDSGLTAWTPTFEQAGVHPVTIEAFDGRGGEASQTFEIDVAPTNRRPSFISTPVTEGRAGQAYRYQAVAVDPDGDAIDFELTTAPEGMSVDLDSGRVDWLPVGISGEVDVVLVARDRAGAKSEQRFVLTVLPGTDARAPVITLDVPQSVQVGVELPIRAQVQDDDEVASVVFFVDETEFATFVSPPYAADFPTPLVQGIVLTVRVVARDPSGNEREVSVPVRVEGSADTTAPIVAALRAPAQAAPGEVISVRAEVSDERGVSDVGFFALGEEHNRVTARPFETEIALPPSVAVGSEVRVAALARDGAGNQASAFADVRIVEVPDTVPPSPVDLAVPAKARPGQLIMLQASAADAGGVAVIDILADGVRIAELAMTPFETPFRVSQDAVVGSVITFQARARDFAGNVGRSPARTTDIVAGADGLIVGQVLDDGSSLPRAGVLVSSADGASTRTDHRGQFELLAPEGSAVLRVEAAAGGPRFAQPVMVVGDAIVRAADIRLPDTPAHRLDLPQGTGAAAVVGDVRIFVPAGALGDLAQLDILGLSEQGLPAPLPLGWTPLRVLHLGPAQAVVNQPLVLAFDTPLDTVAVHFDPAGQVWTALDAMVPTTDLPEVSVGALGTVAFLRPDLGPEVPPPAEPGEPLAGVSPAILDSTSPNATPLAELIPDPQVLFLQPGAVSEVQARLAEPRLLPSGTALEAHLSERYEMLNSEVVLGAARRHTVRLYQRDDGLRGLFPVAPSVSLPAIDLREGRIEVALLEPAEPLGELIGTQGGEVERGGHRLQVPSGASAAPRAVSIHPLDDLGPEALPLALDDPRWHRLVSVDIELGVGRLETSATWRLPAPTTLAPQAAVFVLRQVVLDGRNHLVLAGLARRDGEDLVVDAGGLGLPWDGLRESGRYHLVTMATPVGFISGRLERPGAGTSKLLVHTSALPFTALAESAQAEVPFVLVGALGAQRLQVLDLALGLGGEAEVEVAAAGAVTVADVSLTAAAPRVVAMSPAAGEVGVAPATSVQVEFSRALDPATVNSSSVSLQAGGSEVAATITLLPDQQVVVLAPSGALAADTEHTVTLGGGLRDIFGTALAGGTFTARFTTADTTPPPPPPAGAITAGTPINGRTTVEGTQGAAVPGAVVTVTNLTSGTTASGLAAVDGSFQLALEAGLTDHLRLVLRNTAGAETAIELGRPTPPVGTEVLDSDGGVVQGEGGLAAVIPPGVLAPQTIVRVTPSDISRIPSPFADPSQGFIAGAVDLDIGGAHIPDVAELTFSVDGFPKFDTVDRVPLFEIERGLAVPSELLPGQVLTLRLSGRDIFGGRRELTASLPLSSTPDTTLHTVEVPGSPTLKLTLPRQAAPGQTVSIVAVAEPPDIKLRFPADPSLTGDEQFLLWEASMRGGRPFFNLITSANLVTLPSGERVIETNSPPYRGVRRDTTRLVMLVNLQAALSFAQVMSNVTNLSSGGVLGAAVGMASGFEQAANDVQYGVSLLQSYLTPRPVDLNTFEFAVIPVIAGQPATIQIIDDATNRVLYRADVDALPPNSFSSVLVVGEDDNPLQVAGTTSSANSAVPVDAGITVSFSHLIDTSTVTDENVFITDASGAAVDALLRLQDIEHDRVFALRIQPESPLRADATYKLHIDTGLTRASGKALGEPFEFVFTTTAPPEVVGELAIPGALAFDVHRETAAVVVRDSGSLNGFAVVDLSDPGNPALSADVPINRAHRGPVRNITLIGDAEFTGTNGIPYAGLMAAVSAGDTNVFSSLQVYNLNDPSAPSPLAGALVGAPTEIILQSAELVTIPKIDPLSGAISEIEVIDPFSTSLNGIPKTPVTPGAIDSNGRDTVYFVNQGIGVMTLSLPRAVPPPPVSMRGSQFGPSFIPEDKAGALVVSDGPGMVETASAFSISSPAHLATVSEWVSVGGTVADPKIDRILVNGVSAEIVSVSGQGTTFSVDIKVHEGINTIIAHAFDASGSVIDQARLTVLRDYSVAPLAGPGSVSISLPDLSLGSGSVEVTASVDDVVRFDQIYINGQLASEKRCPRTLFNPSDDHCDWSGTGSVTVPLGAGANAIVATAIDVDEAFPQGRGYLDMRLVEGLALAVNRDLTIFEASGLVEMKTVPIGRAFRVSVAQGASVDQDGDGVTGAAENDDGDATMHSDERRNLALVGTGRGNELVFVDITEPHLAARIGAIALGTYVHRADFIAAENVAVVATGDGIKVIDLTRANVEGLLDEDGDGEDDRVLRTIAMGAATDVVVNQAQGAVYVLRRDAGISVIRLAACARDVGADVSYVSRAPVVRFASQTDERDALLDGIDTGLAKPACAGIVVSGPGANSALLAQGSSACIWREDEQCSTAYQPGLSDYDFELIVPDAEVAQATACSVAIEQALFDVDALRDAEISVFVVRRSVFDHAYRDMAPVSPPSCGSGSDEFGDLCLGRNGLLLKWLLEGEWVRNGTIVYRHDLDLDAALDVLASPIDTDSVRRDPSSGDMVSILADGAPAQAGEGSHIPRLEGREWACLEDFALNQSGARVRVKGIGLGDVDVRWPFYVKEIHKAAKAGVRAVYGRLLASEVGNALVLETDRTEYNSDFGCVTRPPPGVNLDDIASVSGFTEKRCESFAEHIASSAIRSVQRGLDVLTEDDALFAYEAFRRKSDIGPQIATEAKANAFIKRVMIFIDALRADASVRSTYDDTVAHFRDSATRQGSLDRCEQVHLAKFKPELGASELKLKVPVRLYNSSYRASNDVDLALYHDGAEQHRVSAELAAGESRFYAKAFSLAPVLTGPHAVQFMADPDGKLAEYDKGNNFDGFFYYVLYPGSADEPPDTSPGTLPAPPVELPEPPASTMCLIDGQAPPSPAIELLASVDGQDAVTVEIGTDVTLRYHVRNAGNVMLSDIVLSHTLAGTVPSVPDLAPGASAEVSLSFTVPNQAKTLLDIVTARAADPSGNSVGPASAVTKVTVVDPPGAPVVRILSPPESNFPSVPFDAADDETAYVMNEPITDVTGIIRSLRPISSVKVGDVVGTVTGAPPLLEFVVPAVAVSQTGIAVLTVVATDAAGKTGEDSVSVRRLEDDGPGGGGGSEPSGALRVVKRVNGQERVRVAPGDTVTYTIQVINEGSQTLYQINVLDPDALLDDGSGAPVFPPPAPFTLGPGDERTFTFDYTIPSTVPGGALDNQVVVTGVSADGQLAGPARDRAQVWVGDLVLSPDIILMATPTSGSPVTRQLRVLRTADGEDVTATSSGTTYHRVGEGVPAALVDNVRNKIAGLLKGSNAQVPTLATIEFTPDGLLRGTSIGVQVIQAVHSSESTGSTDLRSNYALVITGLAELQSIGLTPHSAIGLGIQGGKALGNVVVDRLRGDPSQEDSDPFFDLNNDPPMILAAGGLCTGFAPVDDLAGWVAGSGFAELTSIKFKFFGGALKGIDILEAARGLLEMIPAVRLPNGIPIPVGPLLARLLNVGATQLLDFESRSPGVVSVRNQIPAGIVTAHAGGVGAITATLDLNRFGLGRASKDMSVYVLPSLTSAEVRVDPVTVNVGAEAEVFVFAKSDYPMNVSYSSQNLAQYLPDDEQAAIGWVRRFIPGFLSPSLAAGTHTIDIIPDDPSNPNQGVSLRLTFTLELTNGAAKVTFNRVVFGFRVPNGFDPYDPAPGFELLADLDDGGALDATAEITGLAAGRTRLGADLCIPFLGSAQGTQANGADAEVIVIDAPSANPQSVSTLREPPLMIVLTGADPSNQPLTFDIVSGPTHGSLGALAPIDATSASVVYTPADDFIGTDTFSFRVSNATQTSAPAQVQIGIANQIPTNVSGQTPAILPQDAGATSYTLSADDADGDELTFSVLNAPVNGSLDPLPAPSVSGTSASVSVTYTPNAGYPGAVAPPDGLDPFTIRVSDGFDHIDVVMPVRVNHPPIANSASTSDVVAQPEPGNPVPVQAITLDVSDLEVSAGTQSLRFELLSPQPPGNLQFGTVDPTSFTFDAALGAYVVSYTLTSTPAGPGPVSDAFEYRVHDRAASTGDLNASGVATAQFAINIPPTPRDVPPGNPPTVLPSIVVQQDIGLQPVELTADDDGVPGNGLGFIITNPTTTQGGQVPQGTWVSPAGGTCTPAGGNAMCETRRIDYTPAPGYFGPDSFTFEVEDGVNRSAGSATVNLYVNARPVANRDGFDPGPTYTGNEDQTTPIVIPVTLNDTDADGDPLNLEVKDTPLATLAGTVITVSADRRRVLYTPAPGFIGEDFFEYVVNDPDGGESEPTEVRVVIEPENQPPVAVNDASETDEDTSVDIPVIDPPATGPDSDPDGDVLVIAGVTVAPAHGSTLVVGSSIRYLPDPDFNGVDAFNYRIADPDGEIDEATVSVLVRPVNDPPVAGDDTNVTDEDVAVDVDVLSNDTDVDEDTLSVVPGSANTAEGTASVLGNGLIRFTPTQDLSDVTATVTYVVSDGTDTDTGTVRIDILPVNDPPVAVPDEAFVNEGDTLSIDVTANDVDVDGNLDPSSVVIETPPATGTAVVNGSQIEFTPDPGTLGTVTFTYSVADLPPPGAPAGTPGARSAPALVTVRINALPVLSDISLVTPCCLATTVDVLAGASDVDGQIVPSTVRIESGPDLGASAYIDLFDRLEVRPVTPGLITLTVTVADNDGARSVPATISVDAGVHVNGVVINEIVPGTEEVELYNTGPVVLTPTLRLNGYQVGSVASRQSFSGGANASSFPTGARAVVRIPGLGLSSTVILREVTVFGSVTLQQVSVGAGCYDNAGSGGASLSRKSDGFFLNNACDSFEWVTPDTLGGAN